MLLYVGAVLLVNGVWLWSLSSGDAGSGRRVIDPAGKDIAVVNLFTGGLGCLAALISLVNGVVRDDPPSFTAAAYFLLFALTYLWVGVNQFSGADGQALGWFCLFVAVTALATGVLTLADSARTVFSTWIGTSWLIWAVLWTLFFLTLAMKRNLLRVTALVTLLACVGTAWLPGYLVLAGKLSMT